MSRTNKLVNVHRQVVRHPQVAIDALAETIFAEKGPEQLLLQKEERKQLQTTISKLPILQQQVLQLRYSDGLSCPEIALRLNKREGAVRKILSRCIISLRQTYLQTEGVKSMLASELLPEEQAHPAFVQELQTIYQTGSARETSTGTCTRSAWLARSLRAPRPSEARETGPCATTLITVSSTAQAGKSTATLAAHPCQGCHCTMCSITDWRR